MIVNSEYRFEKYGVTLSPVNLEQLEMVRRWRNRADIREKMLNTNVIHADQQIAWFNKLLNDKTQVYFVANFKALPIGVASAVNINQKVGSCEPGMYIAESKYQGNIVPFCVAFALNDFLFEELGLSCLDGKVFDSNTESMRFHQACGYSVKDDSDALVTLQLTKDDYIPARDKMARFIRY